MRFSTITLLFSALVLATVQAAEMPEDLLNDLNSNWEEAEEKLSNLSTEDLKAETDEMIKNLPDLKDFNFDNLGLTEEQKAEAEKAMSKMGENIDFEGLGLTEEQEEEAKKAWNQMQEELKDADSGATRAGAGLGGLVVAAGLAIWMA